MLHLSARLHACFMYLDSRLLSRLGGGQFSAFNRCQPGNFLASGPTMRPLPPDFEYRFHSHRILHGAYTCQCIYKPWAQATVLAGQGGDAPSNAFSAGTIQRAARSGRPSTFRPTRLTRFTTRAVDPHACYASALQPGKKSSSRKLVYESSPERLPRQS